jgi:hypothetical protein
MKQQNYKYFWVFQIAKNKIKTTMHAKKTNMAIYNGEGAEEHILPKLGEKLVAAIVRDGAPTV